MMDEPRQPCLSPRHAFRCVPGELAAPSSVHLFSICSFFSNIQVAVLTSCTPIFQDLISSQDLAKPLVESLLKYCTSNGPKEGQPQSSRAALGLAGQAALILRYDQCVSIGMIIPLINHNRCERIA